MHTMRRFLSKQAVNIIFLLLVVVAALTVYFLSHAQSGSSAAATDTPSPSPSGNSSDDAFAGVPESVFIAHLQTAEVYAADPDPSAERAWTLSFDGSPAVEALLSYTVDDGAVSSLDLSFELPASYSADSDSKVERYLAAAADTLEQAQNEALRTALADLFVACDRNGSIGLEEAIVWAQGAIDARGGEEPFLAEGNGCTFLSYQTLRNGADVLVCLLVSGQ